ncbi:protein transport protein HofQ [Mesocricetibacter intestinalis]|uniref:Protein transport protein HofQ n=1 Tax=Mesocricetibacter intestinalis TaxID=1521930 RepID=A0A4R6V960_9PAST|nr:type IV pilus secretin PilQ [Mesocricetibacter intestinalis]TDQ58118.1 protein transport protein HofQ [Mesocricetibacter intestinalis]
MRQISDSLKCGGFYAIFFFFLAFSAYVSASAQTEFSIRLKQAPLAATLQQLAAEQAINLVLDDELEGSLSLQLENTDIHRLLYAVAKIKNLNLHKEENVYYLSRPLRASAGQDSSLLEAPEAEDLVTESFRLQFAKAADVMKSLSGGSGSLLSPYGTLSFDERSNRLLIQDQRKIIRQIKTLVQQLDQPIEQIAIEARIVTINDESLKELGVRWGIFEPSANAHKIAGSLNANGLRNITDNLNVNFGVTASPAASVALQIARINGRLLDLELSALEQEKNVEIIASPRLLTTNKKSASIKQGTEIPYIVANKKNDTQSVEFREAVLGLEVTPHILRDNQILLDLTVSQNAPGNRIAYGASEVVSIDKQEINTQVFARNGETIVLGGVFHDTVTKTEDKVPLLGDIPVIKPLFRRESERRQKRELVIFVTPHILSAPPLNSKAAHTRENEPKNSIGAVQRQRK